MGLPVLVVLNMMDLAEKRDIEIDLDHLSTHLALPVMGASALRKQDVERLKQEVNRWSGTPPVSPLKISYPNEVEEILARWTPKLAPLAQEELEQERQRAKEAI